MLVLEVGLGLDFGVHLSLGLGLGFELGLAPDLIILGITFPPGSRISTFTF